MIDKKFKCKITETVSGIKYDCGDKRKGFCRPFTNNRGFGLNILSIQYSKNDLGCFDESDTKRRLKKKYGVN